MKQFDSIAYTLLFMLIPVFLFASGDLQTNMPSECSGSGTSCGCTDEDESTKDNGTGDNATGSSDGGEGGVSTGSGDGDGDNGNHGDSEDDECIKVRLGLGRTTPWTGSLGCSLKIFADDDAPEIFTHESLHATVGGYTFKRLGQKNLADGVTPAEVVFSHPRGESVTFVFPEGESWGIPKPGVHRDMDERVLMVDAEGWATTADPVYYDFFAGDGTRRRFLATDATGRRGALVSITDARGVTNTPEQMGVDIVYDLAGVRQFLTPSRLADVSHLPDWSGYDVTVYAIGDIPAKDASTGLYALPATPPVKRLSLRRENGGKRAVVTVRRRSGDPLVSAYEYVMGDWSLTRPSGVREEKDRMIADSRAAQMVKIVREPDGTMLSRRESNFKWMSWGFAMTNRVEGFGEATETTAWTYCTGGNGKGQVKTEKRQTGLLIEYTYDSEDRVVSETRSGPGMMTETTTYAYESVDPADTVPPVDTRPRTVVKALDGIECQRTYYVYSPLTDIVERVGEQGAAYGGTNVLRTVTGYWPVVDGDLRSGFVKSVRHEDGRLDLYDYVLASNLWTRTITHVRELSPEPVDGKTTRTVTVKNGRGEKIENRTEAFIGGEWHVVSRIRRFFNAEGNVIRRENLAGQVTSIDWDCCHKVSETEPDGSVTTWDYDVEGREIAASRLIQLDMTNVTWLTTCQEYDGLGRQTAAWQTNRAVRVGLPPHRIRRDALGRISALTDELGNETTVSYDQSGCVSITVNPNGATRTTVRNADGRTVSVTGSSVTPEFHAYGIQPDGTRWTRTVQGETARSPRFYTRYENMLGQVVNEERSGFRSAVLMTTHEYDAYGRLVRTASDGEPTTEYAYDHLGDRIATTRLVGTGAPARPTEFRRTTTLSSFALIDGSLWLVSTNTASCSDDSITPLATSTARQLTGLSTATPARTRSTDLRGNVTENTLRFNAPFSTTIQSPPHATNEQFSVSRYGVELQTVSVSCVTNTFAYDMLGRKVSATDGRGNTTRTEFNAAGQRSATVDALGNRTTYLYNHLGELFSRIDPLGNATVYEYDLRGRKTYEGGATYPVRYTYDIFGNKTSMMTYRDESLGPDSGDLTTWLYDEASGVMTNKVYADGKGPTYDYTPNCLLSRRTWAQGTTTDYAYDGWGNLTNAVYSGDTPAVSISYDAMGRQIEARDAAGTTSFAYDTFGALTNETIIGVAGTNTIERHWDAFGRTTGYTLNPDNPVNPVQVSYSYDGLGHFASVDFNAEAQSGRVEYGYLPGTDLVSGYASGDFSRSVAYEPQRDLISAVTNAFGPTLISAFDYANDAAGHRISRIDTFDGATTTNTFVYNVRFEVVSALIGTNTFGYSYDPIGNRITSYHNAATNRYIANALNQYTAIDSTSPNYDVDGNMTADGSGWHYAWNGENRMICASNADVVITYAYDYRGRMTRKEISRRDAETQSIGYLWDNWNIIRETPATASSNLHPSTDYVWGLDLDSTLQGAGGVGGLLTVIRNDGLFLPTYDANGNIAEYFATNGNIAAHYEYSAFGEPIVVFGELAANFTHQFSTKPYCPITGFLEYQTRKYRPDVGRWLSPDIILETGGINIVSILGNDPINGIDVFGMSRLADFVDCMANCISANDPIDSVYEKLLLNISGMKLPKSFVAKLADLCGDEQMARSIRITAKWPGAQQVTSLPASLAAKLRVSGSASHILHGFGSAMGNFWLAYGLYMAQVEAACTGKCCSSNSSNGDDGIKLLIDANDLISLAESILNNILDSF